MPGWCAAACWRFKNLDYVDASRALGASNLRLIFYTHSAERPHPADRAGNPGDCLAILNAAALSFLGFGRSTPTPEWGLMLGSEAESVFNAPFLVFFPGLAIMITVLSFNLIGDGLRDALDPRCGARALNFPTEKAMRFWVKILETHCFINWNKTGRQRHILSSYLNEAFLGLIFGGFVSKINPRSHRH